MTWESGWLSDFVRCYTSKKYTENVTIIGLENEIYKLFEAVLAL